MLFNSIDFAIFLPITFIIYWLLNSYSLRFQNLFILIVSYIFYGWWSPKFLFLIALSTIIDFTIGIGLDYYKKENTRKLLLWASIGLNLGLLGFFKYFNFFIDNIKTAFNLFGNPIEINSLSIILPVGISFYTFQTMSYTIDVYYKRLTPTKDFIAFSAFVSFFPQLVAGPIERASNLLPQFYSPRNFDYHKSVDGLKQILWGLFKKMVIADNCAKFANLIFENSNEYSGSTLFLGGIFFTFQIYGDFSGYSDIAIGTARLFGFDLMKNFAFPYFSRDIAEFWRRWHISLSTWFRDYLYLPLGGSKGNLNLKIRNTFIIFIVSGFWHGANWTYIFWGLLNALYFLPLLLTNNNRKNIEIVAADRILPSWKDFLRISSTFILVVISWIFFRSENLTQAFQIISEIFSKSLFSPINFAEFNKSIYVYLLIIFFITMEWFGRRSEFAIEKMGITWPPILRWTFYYFLIFLIAIYMQTDDIPFIYFQF